MKKSKTISTAYSGNPEKRLEKLKSLYIACFEFIAEPTHWQAITRLAHFISICEKELIRYEEAVWVLDANRNRQTGRAVQKPGAAVPNIDVEVKQLPPGSSDMRAGSSEGRGGRSDTRPGTKKARRGVTDTRQGTSETRQGTRASTPPGFRCPALSIYSSFPRSGVGTTSRTLQRPKPA